MIRGLGAAALAMLILSGCAPIISTIERFFAPMTTAAPRAPAAAPKSAQAKEASPPVPRRKPAASPELTRVDADPQRLVGLDFDGTIALLGDPAAMLEQPPAKVWAYAGGGCVFRVFFYPGVDDQGFRALAYEVTDEADILGLRWLSDPPVAAPDAPRVLDKDDSVVRRCFAELLDHQESNTG
jgi:hypothetical protein